VHEFILKSQSSDLLRPLTKKRIGVDDKSASLLSHKFREAEFYFPRCWRQR
jgi:hypothetical protein